MLKSMRKSKNRYFYHIFVSPGNAPAIITQYVAWMGRQFNACQTPRRCTHLSSTVSQLFEPQMQKNRHFYVPQPTVLFPWRRPCDYHAICCMDGKTIQCLTNPSQHVPICLNSFRVIRCLNQCVSPKIAIFTTFLFPLGTPLMQSR